MYAKDCPFVMNACKSLLHKLLLPIAGHEPGDRVAIYPRRNVMGWRQNFPSSCPPRGIDHFAHRHLAYGVELRTDLSEPHCKAGLSGKSVSRVFCPGL